MAFWKDTGKMHLCGLIVAVLFGFSARAVASVQGEVFLISQQGTALRMAGALVAVLSEEETFAQIRKADEVREKLYAGRAAKKAAEVDALPQRIEALKALKAKVAAFDEARDAGKSVDLREYAISIQEMHAAEKIVNQEKVDSEETQRLVAKVFEKAWLDELFDIGKFVVTETDSEGKFEIPDSKGERRSIAVVTGRTVKGEPPAKIVVS